MRSSLPAKRPSVKFVLEPPLKARKEATPLKNKSPQDASHPNKGSDSLSDRIAMPAQRRKKNALELALEAAEREAGPEQHEIQD